MLGTLLVAQFSPATHLIFGQMNVLLEVLVKGIEGQTAHPEIAGFPKTPTAEIHETEVADGRIVLLDRYPLEAIGQSKRLRLLDGPSIDPNGHRLVERMARLETRMYERFGLPDGLVLLKVDPRIAIARKPDHDPAVVEEKAEATSEAATLMKLSGNGSKLREVDSNLEWPKPLIQAKEIVWEMLSPGAAGEG